MFWLLSYVLLLEKERTPLFTLFTLFTLWQEARADNNKHAKIEMFKYKQKYLNVYTGSLRWFSSGTEKHSTQAAFYFILRSCNPVFITDDNVRMINMNTLLCGWSAFVHKCFFFFSCKLDCTLSCSLLQLLLFCLDRRKPTAAACCCRDLWPSTPAREPEHARPRPWAAGSGVLSVCSVQVGDKSFLRLKNSVCVSPCWSGEELRSWFGRVSVWKDQNLLSFCFES